VFFLNAKSLSVNKLVIVSSAIIALFSACQPQGGAELSAGGNNGEQEATWYGMMRPVSVMAGEQPNERRISAQEMRPDEFFYYVVFEGVEGKSAIVKFANLSSTELNVQYEGMTSASKWKIGDTGDISIQDGSKRISFVRAGSIVDYNIVTAGAGSTGSPDISGLQNQITELNSKIASLEGELLNDDGIDEDGRVVALEASRDALSQRLNSLEDATIPDLTNRIEVLEGVVATMGSGGDIGDLTSLIASVNELKSWKTIASAELLSLRGELSGVLAELNGAGGLVNWRNEASASLSSLDADTAYLTSELNAVKTTLAGITSGAGARVTEYTGASPVSSAAIGTNSFAYVTFAAVPKGEIVRFSALTTSATEVGPAGAPAKSNWTKNASGDVSYTVANPAINGIWLCDEAIGKELDLQNRRFNTIAENITALNSSLSALGDRVTALEEGVGAMLLPQARIDDIKAAGFATNNSKAASLNAFFNQEGRKYFFALDNVSSPAWQNLPVSGSVSGNVELVRTGGTLSCTLTVNRVDGALTYKAYQGYWNISGAVFAWEEAEGSVDGWIAVIYGPSQALSVATVDFTDQITGLAWTSAATKQALYDPVSGVVSITAVINMNDWGNQASGRRPVVPQKYRPNATIYGTSFWSASSSGATADVATIDSTGYIVVYYGVAYAGTYNALVTMSLTYMIAKSGGAYIVHTPLDINLNLPSATATRYYYKLGTIALPDIKDAYECLFGTVTWCRSTSSSTSNVGNRREFFIKFNDNDSYNSSDQGEYTSVTAKIGVGVIRSGTNFQLWVYDNAEGYGGMVRINNLAYSANSGIKDIDVSQWTANTASDFNKTITKPANLVGTGL
jgi:hypothetical protein